jgi:hypothetical protein
LAGSGVCESDPADSDYDPTVDQTLMSDSDESVEKFVAMKSNSSAGIAEASECWSDSDNETLAALVDGRCRDDETTGETEEWSDSDDEPLVQKKSLSRKRKRQMQKWKKNVRKDQRNTGRSYVNGKSKVVSKRKLGEGCGNSCKRKCQTKLTAENRLETFQAFWSIGNLDRQRQFIASCIDVKPTNRQTTTHSRRSNSYKYHVTVSETKVEVCKKFFLALFGISEKFSRNCIAFRTDGIVRPDKRGKYLRNDDSLKRDFVRDHIKAFPVLPSHYCRSNTSRQYLSCDLTITKMHNMYVDACKDIFGKDYKPLSPRVYREIFNEYNLSFQVPVKDKCDFCTTFKNSSEMEQQEQLESYNCHIQNKDKIRQIKNNVKELAQQSDVLSAICFDLEQVLELPHGEVASFYYSRKICCYNLTTYDLANSDAVCYFWHELIGSRGSIDIASCVYHCIETKVSQGKREIELFSDKCGGQNRNRYFLAMLVYIITKFDIDYIKHHFFESGHSQNENDSIHATIERAKKGKEIYIPEQYITLIQGARVSKSPYKVIAMNHTLFRDFRVTASQMKNFDFDIDGEKVCWLKVNEFYITKQDPFLVKFKYSHSDPGYKTFDLMRKYRGKSVPQLDAPNVQRTLTLSKSKYEDLSKLVSKNLIPANYHTFYSGLPHDDH